MNILQSRVAAIAVALASTFAGLVPAQAFPVLSAPHVAAANPVTDVQYRRDWRDGRDDRRGWYNGHRGYRDRRPGYRYHNGMWFPLAAFATGAIISGAIASQRAPVGGSHVAWCENRYQSYRASDDTYVPRAGVRARCVSPY